jgi:FkbM family methyltransferase
MGGLKELTKHRFPWVYERLRELKFAASSNLFQSYTVEHIYGGHNFKINITDSLARSWYDHGWARLDEIELLSRNGLAEGALVFNLGAHQNVVAMMLAKEVGPTGKVIAIEGTRHNHDIGTKNAALNGFDNIVSKHAVVADHEGEVFFSESLNGSVSVKKTAFLTAPVRAVTIDGLARDYGMPDAVFVDVEGYEIAALKGAKTVLSSRATWFLEVHGDKTLATFGWRNCDVLPFFDGKSKFLYRTDEDTPFVELADKTQVPQTRFFLIVIPPPTG